MQSSTNPRLKGKVTCSTQWLLDANKSSKEFIRRFLAWLPDSFLRIRHDWLLSNPVRDQNLELGRNRLRSTDATESIEVIAAGEGRAVRPGFIWFLPFAQTRVDAVGGNERGLLTGDHRDFSEALTTSTMKNYATNVRRIDTKRRGSSQNGHFCFCKGDQSSTMYNLIHYEAAKMAKGIWLRRWKWLKSADTSGAYLKV